jgi:riboflavin biosynthesis pyrimidine reductase
MKLKRVFPETGEELSLDAAPSRDTLLEWYRPPSPTWVRLNLIASVDGNAAGTDGTSETLTNSADRTILGVIRELSDVVLVGANSVRREGYILPRRSRLAVVTTTGDLTGHRVDPAAGQGKVIVLCPESARDRVNLTLNPEVSEIVAIDTLAGAVSLSMSRVIDALARLGLTSVVCEGGPLLAGQLLADNLVDEACFSTSPIIGGTRLSMLETPQGTDQRLALTQLLVDDSSGLYARWAVQSATFAGASIR